MAMRPLTIQLPLVPETTVNLSLDSSWIRMALTVQNSARAGNIFPVVNGSGGLPCWPHLHRDGVIRCSKATERLLHAVQTLLQGSLRASQIEASKAAAFLAEVRTPFQGNFGLLQE